MSQWSPCKRRDFIHRLKILNFDGPLSGTKHQFMVYQKHRLTVPSNPEYSVPRLRLLLLEVEEIIGRKISANEWNKLA